jgi:DNA-binding response OmpR family regulator
MNAETSASNQGVSVCVVEDENDLREEVVQTLIEYGFDARGFPGSRELYLGLLQQSCDVAVLDIGLPGEDGFSILAHLREASSAGIIMLTARGQIDDRVRALMGGADIYLVKPVDMAELAANIVSLNRRLRATALPSAESHDGWRMSPDGWLLLTPSGASIPLSAAERKLLQVLAQHPGTTVSREALVKALGHHPDDALSNRLDMLISRLRRKVSQASGEKIPLRAIRGIGFSLPATFVGGKA